MGCESGVRAGFGGGLAAMLVSALPVAAQDAPASVADRIWVGGPVLTMEDSAPVAEAIAVKDGLILAVGSEDEILGLGGEGTTVTDLHGRALLPGFVDSHGHVMMGGLQALAANLLAPPDGAVTDIASLQQELRQWAADNAAAVEEADLIVGFGYDNSQLAELRHPTRADLDAVSADRPIIIVHQSGHIAAVNSLALERAGMTADTPEPSGGVIRREADGTTPNGVLEEMAFFGALPRVFATLGPESLSVFARAGAEMWARYGYTTGQEGRATPGTVQVFRQVAEAGSLPIDVVAYVDVLTDRDFIKDSASRDYADHFRVGGAKLTIDGSPQGFTAWRDRPYYDPVGDYPPGYSGYPALTDPEILESVDWAFANDVQILTHANGERATDMLVAAVNAAEDKYGPGDRRPVLVHGQFMRPDQVESLDRLDIFPSLFPMHTFYWGDWHRDHTVGPVNGDNISPTGWVRARGMAFGTHHDAPVALPDSMRVLDATVTRRSRSGDIIGPDQRVDVTTALKAMTIWPAWQHFEEDRKGSLVPGKRADLVILSGDPTAIDPEMLDTLEVVETIKDGETIYRADP